MVNREGREGILGRFYAKNVDER